jgi:hypothetical protein
MFIKRPTGARRGWTLVEMMVAVGVFTISGVALASLYLFSLRGLTAMSNYAMLDKASRQAIDKLTSEIRQSTLVQNYSSNPPSLTLLAGDGATSITYAFDPVNLEMTRTAGGATQVLLTNCTLLQFGLFLRPPSTNAFDLYPVDTSANNWQTQVKVVQLSWKTSVNISPTANVNSENVQTARIVIRKQQD